MTRRKAILELVDEPTLARMVDELLVSTGRSKEPGADLALEALGPHAPADRAAVEAVLRYLATGKRRGR